MENNIPDLSRQLISMTKSKSRALKDIGLVSISQIAECFGEKIKEEQWDIILEVLTQVYEDSKPSYLLNFKVTVVEAGQLEKEEEDIPDEVFQKLHHPGVSPKIDSQSEVVKALSLLRVFQITKSIARKAFLALNQKVSSSSPPDTKIIFVA